MKTSHYGWWAVVAGLLAASQPAPAAAGLSFALKSLDSGTFIVVSGTFDYSDSLDEFSRLVRDNNPRVVTFNSPGGNILKAIELGRLIRQSALNTVQLRSLQCESACAFAFVGGVERYAEPGAIGVHRASLSDSSSTDVTSAVSSIQELTAMEITYLGEMGVDPALMQVALTYDSSDIRYLSGSEMEKYRVTTTSGVAPEMGPQAATTVPAPAVASDVTAPPPPTKDWSSYGEWIQLFSRQVLSDAADLAATYRRTITNTFVFKYDNGWFVGAVGPFRSGTATGERDRLATSGAIPQDSFVVTGSHFAELVGEQNQQPTPASTVADPSARAIAAAQSYEQSWSLQNPKALDYLDALYASQITYFGKLTPKQSVMREKAAFAARWPERLYTIEPGTMSATCTPDDVCSVRGIVDWRASSEIRGATSTGSASFELIFSMADPIRLVSESSSVLTRQTSNGQPGR